MNLKPPNPEAAARAVAEMPPHLRGQFLSVIAAVPELKNTADLAALAFVAGAEAAARTAPIWQSPRRQAAKTGRLRSNAKRQLPAGLYERKGYWSFRNPATGREVGIGRVDRAAAVAAAQGIALGISPRAAADARLATLTATEIVAAAAHHSTQCGVYFLVAGGCVMYVGQSTQLGRRLGEHAVDVTKPFDSFHFIQVPPEMLDATERAYISALQPPWNTAGILEASWMSVERALFEAR